MAAASTTCAMPIRRPTPALAWSTNPFTLSPAAGSPFDPSTFCNLGWRDDILPSSPLTISMSPRSPPSRFHESELAPRVEEKFFKDFTCCGFALPDLHDVMSHYEQAHVVVRGLDSLSSTLQPSPFQRTFSTPVCSLSGVHSSVPSVIPIVPMSNVPRPPTQQQQQQQSGFATTTAFLPTPSRRHSHPPHMQPQPLMTSNDDLELEMEFDNHSLPPPSLSSASLHTPLSVPSQHAPQHHQALLHHHYSLPPSIFFNSHHPSPESSPSPPPQHRLPLGNHLGPGLISRSHSLSRSTGGGNSKRRNRGIEAMDRDSDDLGPKLVTRDRGGPNSAKKEGRTRYRCPRDGCTKAYLNPNGLKYHITKGTCDIKPM